jgi:O-antigen/teichoic acid export membrane protein
VTGTTEMSDEPSTTTTSASFADGEDLTSRVFAGTRWKAISSIAVQIARLAIQIVLARLLVPAEFGVVAVAIVVINFLDIVMDLGTGVAMIQRRDLPQALASAVFVMNAAIGVALFGVTFASAGLIAGLFGAPEATSVVQVMSLALLITSLARTQHAMLKRRLEFRSLAMVDISGAVTNAAVAIPAAALGAGVWALVAGHLAYLLVSSVVAYRVSGWLPNRPFDMRGLLGIARFSLNVVGYQLARFFLLHVDKLVISRYLGISPLGVYSLAERFMQYPVTMLSQSIIDVMTPALSRAQEDKDAVGRGALRALGAVALVTFPIMIGLASVAREFVLVVLGARWVEVIPLIQILGPVGAIHSLVYASNVVFVAVGRADLLFRLTLATGLVNLTAYLIGVRWGLNGFAIAYAVAAVIMAVPGIFLPLRLVGVRPGRFARLIAPFAVAVGALVVAASAATRSVAAIGGGPPIGLVAGVASGAVAYVTMLFLQRPPALLDVLRLVGLDRKLALRR